MKIPDSLFSFIISKVPALLIVVVAIILLIHTMKKMKYARNLKFDSGANSPATKAQIDKLNREIRIEFIICAALALAGILWAFFKK